MSVILPATVGDCEASDQELRDRMTQLPGIGEWTLESPGKSERSNVTKTEVVQNTHDTLLKPFFSIGISKTSRRTKIFVMFS